MAANARGWCDSILAGKEKQFLQTAYSCIFKLHDPKEQDLTSTSSMSHCIIKPGFAILKSSIVYREFRD